MFRIVLRHFTGSNRKQSCSHKRLTWPTMIVSRALGYLGGRSRCKHVCLVGSCGCGVQVFHFQSMGPSSSGIVLCRNKLECSWSTRHPQAECPWQQRPAQSAPCSTGFPNVTTAQFPLIDNVFHSIFGFLKTKVLKLQIQTKSSRIAAVLS